MPFKQVFERRMNRNMQESEAGPAPPDEEMYEKDTKGIRDRKDQEYEEEDIEISEKKDRPPRFSTLFDSPSPQIIERCVEPRRKSGIYIPTPLFVVLAFVLFFESTLLFAYTIIGLYNNLPHGILPFGGSSTSVVGACDCTGQQAGINFAPNFYMPGTNADAVTIISSATPLPDLTSAHTSTTDTSTSTSSSTSPTGNTAVAAGLISFLRGEGKTHSTPTVAVAVTTVTPTRKVVLSTVEQTVVPGQPTSTSYTTVAPPSSTNAKRASPASAATSTDDSTTSVNKTTPTTLKTSPSPTTKDTSKTSPTSTTTTNGVGGVCFGAGGAVFQNCIN